MGHRFELRLPIGIALAVLVGCAGWTLPPAGGSGARAPEAAPVADAATPPSSPPAALAAPEAPSEAVRDALLPPLAASLEAPPLRDEPRFDISVNEAPAPEFFMGLVAGTPYSVVVDPSVNGSISLTLRDATIPAVMEAVRDAYGYEYRTTEYGFHVLPQGFQSRIFRVDYLNVARRGGSETRVSSGQVSEGARTSARRTNGVELDRDDDAVSGSRVETRTRVDFWNELTASLEAIVGVGEGRSVVASPHTGIVVVRATPAELRDVEHFLASVQESLQRQVILEAKILEVVLSDGYQSGINWATLIQSGQDSAVVGQTGGGSFFQDGVSEIAGELFDLNPAMPDLTTTTASSAFGGVFTIALEASKFTAFIELLETQGEVSTLSNPRISTVNNQRAVIKVGSDEFFVTDVSSTTVTGTATTTTPDITLTPFFSGIALDVTPQIGSDGDVVLHIHPSVSEVVDQTKQITVGGETQTLPLALSTIRESDSIIRARSGQVVVIGGLMQDDNLDEHAGLPGLARIPLLGRLFRHERNALRKRELVILLRPTIVGESTWTVQLDDTGRRLDTLRPGASEPLRSGFIGDEPRDF